MLFDPMPRLILHAGTHVTGSAAIQHALARRRDELRAVGLHYPDAGAFFGRDAHSHHPFAEALADTDDLQLAIARDFAAHVRDETADDETVVLSAESMHRQVDGVDDWRRIPDPEERWARRRAYLHHLADALDGFDVEVAIVVTRPDRFVEAFYAAMAARRPLPAPFHRWRDTREWLCDYSSHIELWHSVFPHVAVFRCDEVGRAPRAFLDWLGLEAPDEVPADRATPDARLLLWLRLAHPDSWAACRDFAVSEAATGLFDDLGSATLWGSLRERLDFLHRFPGPYGHAFFDPPTETGPPAALDDVAAGRIADRWRRWQHEARAKALVRASAARAAGAEHLPAPSAGNHTGEKAQPLRPSRPPGALRLQSVDEPNSRLEKHRQRFEVIAPFVAPGSTGAELGTFKGNFLDHLLSAGPRRVYAVDPWYRDTATWPWAKGDPSTVDALATILATFKDEIDAGVLVPRVEYSTEFLASLPDGALDWVYVDSTHGYEQTRRELALCQRKVKPSGYVIGDDYQPDPAHPHYGVWRAVQERVRAGALRLLVDGDARQFVAVPR